MVNLGGDKHGRARGHAKRLNAAIDQFLQTDPYREIRKFDADHRQYVYRAQILRETPAEIALLIGDTVHNYRSALDHLAWELAGPSPPSGTEFPIFDDICRFAEWSRKRKAPALRSGIHKIRGLPSGAQEFIGRVQPWTTAPSNPEQEPLMVLHNLDRVDKHRELHTTGGSVASVAFETLGEQVWGTRQMTFEAATGVEVFSGPFEDGDIIATRHIPAGQLEFGNDPKFTFDVSFDKGFPGYGQGVKETILVIDQVVTYIRSFLRHPSRY